MAKHSFGSSKKDSDKTETHFQRDTAANIAMGAAGATVTNILGEVIEDAGEAVANKLLPGSGKVVGAVIDFALDSGTAIGLNEGLEVSRDGESFFNEDFWEDALVAVASNSTGAVVVGILGVTGAPALVLALLTSAVMGAAYSVSTSLEDRFALPGYNDRREFDETPSRQEGSGSVYGGRVNSHTSANHQSQSEMDDSHRGYQRSNSEDFVDSFMWSDQTNHEEQSEGDTTWRTYDSNGIIAEDGSEYSFRLQKEYNSDGEPTGRYRDQDNETGEYKTKYEWEDHDHDGVDKGTDKDDSDPSVSTPNPMNDNGDTSHYDGRHNGLRGFRGDIDYGPDGESAEGYSGEHDELIGFNPWIDYGPDGKKEQGYRGEYDDLIGLNPRVDWDRDHANTGEFKGNALTELLGKINPRSNHESLASTSTLEDSLQAKNMGLKEPESIYDNQAANLFAGANSSAIGFGSGVTIEEIETDGNLSLVAIDFF